MRQRVPRPLWAVFLLLVAGAARAEAPVAPADDPQALLRAFFTEGDAAKRAALADRFGAVAPKSWADLKAMLHATAPREPLTAGRHRFEITGDDGTVPYLLRVPPGYANDTGRGWPLVVACPWLNGTADEILSGIEGWLGPDADQYLIAATEYPEAGAGKYRPLRAMIECPVRVLSDVRQRANVDSDRTILAGISKGGYATWATIFFSPGEWAGAVPTSSSPRTEALGAGRILYLPNVLHLAIQAHWGANDLIPGQTQGVCTSSREVTAEMKRLGATLFEGIEYPGEGHVPNFQTDRIRTFVAAARRDPFPPECHLLFHHLYQGHAYGVRATAVAKEAFDFQKPRTLTIARPEDLPRAQRNLYRREGYELIARLPPGKNRLEVLARNLKEVEIELPVERLDFARPIHITVNGKTVYDATHPMDWRELLETVRQTGDFERLIGGRLRTAVLGPPPPIATGP